MTLEEHSKILDDEIDHLIKFPLKIKKTMLLHNMEISQILGKYGCNIYKLKKYYCNDEYITDKFIKEVVEDERIPIVLSAMMKQFLPVFKEYVMRYYEEQSLYD
jgi:hypothetical protein